MTPGYCWRVFFQQLKELPPVERPPAALALIELVTAAMSDNGEEARLVLADWYEEHGQIVKARSVRGHVTTTIDHDRDECCQIGAS